MMVGLFLGVLSRHAYLAVDNQKFLLEKSKARTRREINIPSEKAQVLDRNEMLLAVSLPYYRFAINPKLHAFGEKEIEHLAVILEKPKQMIVDKINNAKTPTYVKISDKLSHDQMIALSDLSWEGLMFEEKKGRYYPLGEKAAPLIGYVNVDGEGLIGVEYQFNQYMGGMDGKMIYTQNLLNQVTKVHHYQSPMLGKDLRLTLDYRLQYEVYDILKKAVEYHDAESAAAVILSASEGEVLAMVSYPSFDPNKPIQSLDDRTKNKPVMDLFEPGSIIKPFALVAILEEQDHSDDEIIDVQGANYEYLDTVFKDHEDLGSFPFSRLLSKSSNIAMVQLVHRLPKEALLKVYDRFGLFGPTFVQLPGESIGRHVPNPTKIDEGAMSYGYGLSVNLLSIAKAYNVLANQGLDRGVHLVFEKHRPEPERVFDQDLANRIKDMMVFVTEEGISSRNAKVKNIKVAGKSGTTHLLGEDKTYKNEYISSFAGYAPSDKPKFVVSVMVKRPKKHGHYGGQVAAPIFSKLIKAAFNYLPSEDETWK